MAGRDVGRQQLGQDERPQEAHHARALDRGHAELADGHQPEVVARRVDDVVDLASAVAADGGVEEGFEVLLERVRAGEVARVAADASRGRGGRVGRLERVERGGELGRL